MRAEAPVAMCASGVCLPSPASLPSVAIVLPHRRIAPGLVMAYSLPLFGDSGGR
jgi:hypothetical protein